MPAQRAVLITLAVLSLLAGATGLAAADYQVEIDVPTEPTAGEQTTIEGAVSTEDRPGDWEADVTVTLYVDGTQVAQRTVTVQDGETARVAFDYTFESAGEHDVRLESETSYGQWSYSDSVTRTVSVAPGPTAIPTVTAPGDTAQYEGAAFAVPPGLEDEVADLRQGSDDLAPHAFVLATESELYLVFTETEPASGAATVTGVATGETVTTDGLSLSVVAATESSFTTTGERVALSELVADPTAYELALVRVDGTDTRIASVANTDDGSSIDLPTTAGQLSERGATDSLRSELFRSAALATAGNASARPPEEGIATTQVRTAFWQEAGVQVDGIVVTEDTAARRYLAATMPEESLALPDDGAVLYVVTEARSPKTVTVEEVTTGEAPQEELIQFTASVGQARVSVEESLEESTPCEDAVPVKEVCVPLTQDVTIHAGVAWTGDAGGPSETAVLVGASSRLQQTPVTTAAGEYRVTGEVVAADAVNVPTGDAAQVVLVYELERQSDVAAVPDSVQSRQATFSEAVQAEAAKENETVAASVSASQTADGTDGVDDNQEGSVSNPTSTDGGTGTSADGRGLGLLAGVTVLAGVLLVRCVWRLHRTLRLR